MMPDFFDGIGNSYVFERTALIKRIIANLRNAAAFDRFGNFDVNGFSRKSRDGRFIINNGVHISAFFGGGGSDRRHKEHYNDCGHDDNKFFH